jgi:subtilisin family serine protease
MRARRRSVLAVVLPVVAATIVVAAPIGRASQGPATSPQPAIGTRASTVVNPVAAPGAQRWIVRLRDGASVDAEETAARGEGGHIGHRFTHVLSGYSVEATPAQIARIKKRPEVAVVEADVPTHTADAQETPPWGLDRIDQRALPLSNSYSYLTNGAGVNVYLLDTGILRTHQEFTGRVATGVTFINDGRGTNDCNGHGTHVAGIAGGTTYGVAKAVTLVPVRVLDCTGSGFNSDVIAGLDWVVADHAAGVPAVVNLSMGSVADSVLDAAVARVIADGVSVAAAAGNNAGDACNVSPARAAGAITVAASDQGDASASFNNTGPCVDLYAPGVLISSAWATTDTAVQVLSGTSMSTPFATGMMARLLSTTPTASPATIGAQLLANATPNVVVGVPLGTVNKLIYGEGRVTLSGTVTDSTGAPVPGISIDVKRNGIGADASTSTDATGAFTAQVSTGPITVTMSAGSATLATLPLTWTLPPVTLTMSGSRTLALSLPPTASALVQVYDATGAPVPGVTVSAVGTYSSPGYSPAPGLAPIVPTSTARGGVTDANGRVNVSGFLGTLPTLIADDTSTGTLVRATGTNLAMASGTMVTLQRGGTGFHVPTFLVVDPTVGTTLIASLLSGTPDLVIVPVGKTGITRAFGCQITRPANATEARNAVLAATYVDTTGATAPVPDGPCRLQAASVTK